MFKEIKTAEEYEKYDRWNDYTFVDECPHCGRVWAFTLSDEEYDAMEKWKRKEVLIQDALPERDGYQREFIRYVFSGMPSMKCCPECTWGEW